MILDGQSHHRAMSMALLSKLRIRQLLTDEKGLMIYPRELIGGFKYKKHQVRSEQLWQVQADNHDPPMMEYFELFTGESEGITPGQLLGIVPAPSKEPLPVDQDMVMASANGDESQGNEEHARLTASVTKDTIPTATPKINPPFATLNDDLQSAVGNQPQSEWKWLHFWDEFEPKEASQWKVYELRVAQKKAEFKDDQTTKKACFQIDQVERQKGFQHEHLSWEIRFENKPSVWSSHGGGRGNVLGRNCPKETPAGKQVKEESQQSLANHIQAVGKIVDKATPVILQLTADLLTTWGVTIPVAHTCLPATNTDPEHENIPKFWQWAHYHTTDSQIRWLWFCQ